ncbi:MAG: low molecular weight phosphotyrosine protein phosphatase [Zoogloeaceae bacterium]|jgi:protein-tyrosine phosphatase|nr:low molecular weight phosphotyrosine protein phosphatase [Zoogloeaceae bacterium]
MTKILLICMGNICRSPTAEGVLRTKLEEAGLAGEVKVDSAGTHAYHVGEPPDPRSQKAAAKRGYRLEHLRARHVAAADFLRFDLILAMDRDNLALLQKACPPEERHRLGLLLNYARDAHHDEVPDPYYGGPSGFEQVLDLIEAACDGLIDSLRSA